MKATENIKPQEKSFPEYGVLCNCTQPESQLRPALTDVIEAKQDQRLPDQLECSHLVSPLRQG